MRRERRARGAQTDLLIRILGIPYKEVKMTFADIRSTLEKLTGNPAVTVPTLEVAPGQYVTDSFKIAEWVRVISRSLDVCWESVRGGCVGTERVWVAEL